jgi:hypothetical protein
MYQFCVKECIYIICRLIRLKKVFGLPNLSNKILPCTLMISVYIKIFGDINLILRNEIIG